MRRLIGFACEGESLAATLDEAPGTTGLLIVSGGNEIRSGAHRGMAMLAQSLAATGTPVFRYDRRGVGDSTGDNGGFLSAEPDLIEAVTAFRAQAPRIARLIGFGNCDAASTLALFGRSAGIDRVVLANPWVIEPFDDLPPAAAIRARYAERLRDPRSWYRMIRGEIDLRKLVNGVRKLSRPKLADGDALAGRVCGAIDDWGDRAVVLLAARDATALAFAARYRGGARVTRFDTASHSFAGVENAAALYGKIVTEIAGQ
ncbi:MULTISPECIES: hydrolase 1, exosortase A system-associated [Sphingomonas]|uniref:hydrolase 1, exosortase A system-associated n=1 Tax=Sphingomonas TaxID=13687 RepID=UPI00104BDCFA|nr:MULTISPECIES: hydrolase 1, exosortase A system-associated [Sphingomonas]TCQ07337.1 exosortase A-associated hydrolase 1 [Sphingomonas sp. PP-CC-3A-396]